MKLPKTLFPRRPFNLQTLQYSQENGMRQDSRNELFREIHRYLSNFFSFPGENRISGSAAASLERLRNDELVKKVRKRPFFEIRTK